MHVAFVAKSLGPRGGTEEYVRAVGERLRARGYRLSFLYEEAPHSSARSWSLFRDGAARTHLSGDGESRGRTLSRHITAHEPDVLFVHGAWFGAEMYRAAAGSVGLVRFVHDFRAVCLRVAKVFPLSRRNCTRTLGYPCLLHACSIGPARGGWGPVSWNSLRAKLVEREVCRRFDRVMVASHFMRDLLLRNGFQAARVNVNPLFSPSDVPPTPPVFPMQGGLLYVGQLERFKGLSVLLEAMRFLPEKLRLDVAGDGAWRGQLQTLAVKWNLRDRVSFHGWVERERLGAIFDRAGAVVVPSVWNEPFGLVGLQAMAHARPVVAFAVGGIPEWLADGHTGVLAPDLNAASLATAIAQLWADRARAEWLGVCGYRRLREHFTAERHVDQLAAELEASTSAMRRRVS